MSIADRLDHENTAAESHYCYDRNIVMSVSNGGKKTDEPGNAFVELMSCNRERAGFKIQPTQVALRQVPCGKLDLLLNLTCGIVASAESVPMRNDEKRLFLSIALASAHLFGLEILI